ncbi:MAG: formylmethanofuran--tetrahydromethanopterin N-formyltransferase [Planctomycetota bacterium]
MKLNNIPIVDTFAEGFSMRFTRLIVTAINEKWVTEAVREVCGYGSSVIGCDAEAGLERMLAPEETIDGRVGASLLMFAFSTDDLKKAIANRVGQCLMTCPTTAVFDGLNAGELQQQQISVDSFESFAADAIPVGDRLRYFGDGYQKSKMIGDRRFWRIPVMDGEFIVEDSIGVAKGVAGGNFLLLAKNQEQGLSAAEAAVNAIGHVPNVITPFPGGVVRSGSKVGSKYKALFASTSHSFCPTLKGAVESNLSSSANCVYEIVIDGTDFNSVAAAMKSGIKAATEHPIEQIHAGNYGGKLGKHHFHLHQILS